MNGNGELLKLKQKIRTASEQERITLFLQQPVDIQAQLISSLRSKLKSVIINNLVDEQIQKILHFLAPDDITDLLRLLPEKRQSKILVSLEKEMKSKVEYLLKFSPKSVAGMMNLDYIIVSLSTNTKDIARLVKKHYDRTGRTPVVLVLEGTNILGELPWHYLALPDINTIEKKYIRKLLTVKYDLPKENLIQYFKHNKHNKAIVLDNDNSVMGIIYTDDIIALIEESSINNIYAFAAVEKEEDVLDSFLTKIKHRWKWLALNLLTAFIAAGVVSLFDATISKYVLLAVYMPIVAGMGGNAGSQTMAVMVRGLTLKEVDLNNAKRVIVNELLSGLGNGLIIGLIVSIVLSLFNQNFVLGIILGISMIINLGIAGLFGALIPLILKTLGKDPATASTIFITTATDVFGFFTFLGLATLIL